MNGFAPPVSGVRWPLAAPRDCTDVARSVMLTLRPRSDALDDEREAHSADGAHGHKAHPGVAAGQLVDHGDEHPGSGGRDRMAQADPAAVDIHDRLIEAQLARAGDSHGGERLVDLHEVDLI